MIILVCDGAALKLINKLALNTTARNHGYRVHVKMLHNYKRISSRIRCDKCIAHFNFGIIHIIYKYERHTNTLTGQEKRKIDPKKKHRTMTIYTPYELRMEWNYIEQFRRRGDDGQSEQHMEQNQAKNEEKTVRSTHTHWYHTLSRTLYFSLFFRPISFSVFHIASRE